MRHLSSALLLTLAIVAPAAAHASEIDDFVLTSAHHVYTFSLTTPYYTGDNFGHPLTNFGEFGPGTIDGVGGYNLGGYWYVNNCCSRSGVDFSLPTGETYQLVGQDLGGYATPFLTGTFNYVDDPYSFNPNLVVARDGPYTLTVTPDTSTSVTPEPGTLTLLATGSLALVTALRSRLA